MARVRELAGNVAAKDLKFLPFKEALLYARSLKLTCQKEWEVWSKSSVRPLNIPSAPHATYKHDGWQGYGHWLGTGNQVGGKLDFLPFKKALLQARSLKLKSEKEWREWRKSDLRPVNVPTRPDQVYKHGGWQGYMHWLGTGTVAPKDREFMPFKKALLHARSLELMTRKEWREWCTSSVRPANMPSFPEQVYTHDGWQGYGHWLGTCNQVGGKLNVLPFKKALRC